MRLLAVELRRAFARRFTRALVLVLVGVIALAGAVTAARSTKTNGISPQERAFFDDCVQRPIGPIGAPDSLERRQACTEIARSEFPSRTFDAAQIPGRLEGGAALTGAAMFLLCATLIGAEWRAGSLVTQLTWESRRARVFLMRLLAALIVAMIFYLLAEVFYGLVMWLVVETRGTITAWGAGDTRIVLEMFGRGAGFVAILGALGFAIGNIGRNTAVALGVSFLYTAILENLIGAAFGGLRPWLLVPNLVALVHGSRISIGDAVTHSPGVAAITLVVIDVVIAGISYATLGLRDIT